MSIYATPISQLKTSDLAELLQEQAVENTRLEFKREVPEKDETLPSHTDTCSVRR
jgi:hypothetical protein